MYKWHLSKTSYTSIAIPLLLWIVSFNAQATLSSYTVNGEDLVYSSESNVTWTKDGNLLGSMIANQGFEKVVNDILSVSPVITSTPNYSDNYTGSYTLTINNDFMSNGRVSWFGAMAFINYLNYIKFAGNDQWRLPTQATIILGTNSPSNGTTEGNEFSELFYTELNGSANSAFPSSTLFYNQQSFVYWSGTEFPSNASYAWYFNTTDGDLYITFKDTNFYAWAVNTGQITTVSETDSVAMLLAGLGVLSLITRRNKKV